MEGHREESTDEGGHVTRRMMHEQRSEMIEINWVVLVLMERTMWVVFKAVRLTRVGK